MFDVIHVLYEEDITPMWEQHIDVKDQVRNAIYPLLYGRPYKFATKKAEGEIPEGFGPNEVPVTSGDTREVKPYIPPTDPEKLMEVLGVPMGGL